MGAEVIIVEVIGWGAAASSPPISCSRSASSKVVNSGYNGAIPSAVLNVIWAAMGLFTLWSVWRARQAVRSIVP